MPQGVCIANMAQKKNACTTFGPWIVKTVEPFFTLCQPRISPRARYPPQGIANRVHPARSYPNLMNMDHLSLHLSRFAQVFNKDNPR